MEHIETPQQQTAEKPAADNIQAVYLDYVLTEGHPPVSVYALAKKAGIDENTFYAHFSTLGAIEQAIWAALFSQTQAQLRLEPKYAEYSVREKVLALFFTWVEVLKPKRSFVVYAIGNIGKKSMEQFPAWLAFKKLYLAHAEELVEEGLASGELQARPTISDRYAEALWVQFLFVTKFWAHDTSSGFEQTDTAIEKGVRLAFDLLGQNFLDSAADFAKYVWQNKRSQFA